MKNSQKGFAPIIILIIALAVLVVGGSTYVVLRKQEPVQNNPVVQDTSTTDVSASIGSSSRNSVTASTLKLLDIGLLPTPYRGENITEFPLGQVFEMSAYFDTSNSPPKVDLKNISVEVSVANGRVVTLVELECEKTQNIFYCANNVWNTSNLSGGQRQYKFNVTGTDSLREKVQGFIVRDFTFKDVSRNLCKAVYPRHNTDDVAKNKMNLVFVGSGYSNVRGETFSDVFTKVAAKLIDLDATGHGLFSVEPFKSNKKLFNFWYIDKSYPLERCTLINDSCLKEDILELAESCPYPNSYVVEVHDRNAYNQEVGASTRSVVVAMPYYKFSDPTQFADIDSLQRTFVHEFGHTFADLGDEYVYFPDQTASIGQIDIQKLKSIFQTHKNIFYGSLNECQQDAPWHNVLGTGCFEGAGKIGLNAFRPTENSLMRDQFLGPFTFGPYNSLLIKNTLDRFLTKSKFKEVKR
ncbi:MAG: M64 family metallopeptidase [Candidatus Vogelbacteria bacterium]